MQHYCLADQDSGMIQGLGDFGRHKSRLEKEKEAAIAARKVAGSSPPVTGKLPSYMRPTSASKAMQKVCSCATADCYYKDTRA